MTDHILQASLAILMVRQCPLQSLTLILCNTCTLTPLPEGPYPFTTNMVTALSSLVLSLRTLTKLHCEFLPLTPRAVWALGHLNQLQVLRIHIPDDLASWRPEVLSRNDSFPSLKTVALTGTARAYISLSEMFAFPCAHSAKFSVISNTPTELIPKLFLSISRLFPQESQLNYIKIQSSVGPEDGPMLQYVVHSDDIRTLLQLSQLRGLRITLSCHYSLDDPLLLDIASRLPQLEILELGPHANAQYDTLPTLAGLAHLAAHAHHLHCLTIGVDAQSWEPFAQRPSKPLGPVPLRFYGALAHTPSTSPMFTLALSTARVSGSESATRHVAVFLARVFPQLRRVFPRSQDAAQWADVNRSLDMFAVIRQDERQRVRRENELAAQVSNGGEA